MALPEQIRKQLEEVDSFLKSQKAEGGQPPQEPPTPEGEQSPPIQADATTQPVEPSPQEPPVVQPVPDNWEAKYRTLQGKFDAEVPRLSHTLRERDAQIASLQQFIANMGNQSAPSQPTQTSQSAQKLISDQDVKDYGADTIDLVRRVVREEVGPLVQQIRGQLSQVGSQVSNQVQQISSRQQMSADETFFLRLDQMYPEWKQINANTKFHAWLAEVDPMTGIARQTYLDDARRSLDVPRVIAIFKQWTGTGSAPATPSQSPKPNPASELERQVAPGKSRSDISPVTGQKPTYTPAQISKFYDDVLRGKYKNQKSEQEKIERDIFEAQRENRIVHS